MSGNSINGHPIVSRVMELEITGNVVPMEWF